MFPKKWPRLLKISAVVISLADGNTYQTKQVQEALQMTSQLIEILNVAVESKLVGEMVTVINQIAEQTLR